VDHAPLIDVRQNGIGDVVVACWIVHSAAAAARRVRLNPRAHWALARLLDVPGDCVTEEEASDWSQTLGLGHQFEYEQVSLKPMSRFDAWSQSLGLPGLAALRPPYREASEDGAWADEQWEQVETDADTPRVLLFPDVAWSMRGWPKAYFIDLAIALTNAGYAVAAMAAEQPAVEYMPCRWWSGFSLGRVAAMAVRATVAVANDSGPAHLASTVGTHTIAICGPTDPALVFAHDRNVEPVTLDARALACVGCHFSARRGYRHACEVGGCQALMRLDPLVVEQRVRHTVAGRHVHVAARRA
jgi:hypothetical protein